MKLLDEDLIKMYRYMLLARRFDEKVIELFHQRKGTVESLHSPMGQEAIGVGACYGLRKDDYILPSLRTRPGLFVRGVLPRILLAGVFGRVTGPARARVPPHHLGDTKLNIIGTTGIVGGHLTVAPGVALKCRMRMTDSVVLCFLGDGASSRGDFHEGLNFSSVKKLPLIYIVENNCYAQWTPVSSQMAVDSVSLRASGYGIPGISIDGNDILLVYETVQRAVERARRKEGPSLIECKSFRIGKHVERIEEHRAEEEINGWRKNDPLIKFERHLIERNILTDESLRKLNEEVMVEVYDAVRFSLESPFPEPRETLLDVYKKPMVDKEIKKPGESGRMLSMGDALREALVYEMERDDRVFLIGEDIGSDAIGPTGGLWPTTSRICTKFPDRVIGTPLSEAAIVGVSIGAALTGMRPVAELSFADFLALAMDQVVNYASKMRYLYAGEASVPMVLRTATGVTGYSLGLHHSQSVESWIMNVPGLKIVMPSTPCDAKGLLISSIRDEDPVIFFEHKQLYNIKGYVPEDQYTMLIGKADVKKEGTDCTIVATGLMVHKALLVADRLKKDRIEVEVIDPRTLLPLDEETILNSVKKTGRLVIVHEAPKTGGFGGEVTAIVAEHAIGYLDAPIIRVTAPFTPVPFSPPLEKFYVPDEEDILSAVRKVVGS